MNSTISSFYNYEENNIYNIWNPAILSRRARRHAVIATHGCPSTKLQNKNK